MSQSRATDFTIGSIPRHLIVFSIPMLLGNLLQTFYNTVDSIWVGRFLGPEALAAVSVSAPIIFSLVAIVMGLTMASTVLVAQFAGAKKPELVERTIANSLVLLTLAAALVSLIGIVFRRPILRLVNTPAEIFDMASDYLAIFLAGLVFMFVYNALSAIMRGLGDSRTPLIFLAYATIINIVLDPLMIFGVWPFPRMGVAGAAMATDVAQAISAFLGLRYLHRAYKIPLDFSPRSLDPFLTRNTFKIGLPAGAQQMVVSLAGLAVSSTVNSFGKTVAAAYGVGLRLDQFAFLPAMTFSLAVSSLVGQNLGAGKEDRVRETVRWSITLAGGISVLVTIIMVLVPRILLSVFTQDQSVLEVGTSYLRTVSLSYLPLATMFTLNGVMRGAGDTMPGMINTMTSLWFVRVPLARYLSTIPALGSRGIWIGIASSPLVGLALSWGYYRTGRWRKKVLRHPEITPSPTE
ncbi:MAG TPA: MATE family efflux transporter [Firmicutes bacterium]|nr:MATE family efflux transporter [Bacillota bacterium]